MSKGDVVPALIVLFMVALCVGFVIRIESAPPGEESTLLTNDQLFGVDSASGLYWPIPSVRLDIPVGADTVLAK